MKRLGRWLSVWLLCALLASAGALGAAAASTGFRDVPAGHWAASYINQAVEKGLIQGETATTFGLGHPMTRAAFTVVLCRFFGWEMQTPASGSFTDNQDPSAWYYSAVETACANGAVTRQSSRFRPADPVTREEMAVALIRALGYTTLAGIDQGMACPFRDVESNKGYLTMAYYLGISGGTSAATFSPESTATREQAVVMLMRVYDRYLRQTPGRIGVASSANGLTDLTGFQAVAVSGARLTATGAVTALPAEPEAQLIRETARAAGASALLGVTGSQNALQADPAVTAAAVAEAAADYEGVLLDVRELPFKQRLAYTRLVTALRESLGKKLLYVTAEVPDSSGREYGYDYGALSARADRLILRAAPYSREINGIPTTPLEPLEEIYYALALLKGQIDPAKCSLWLTTTGLTRKGSRDGAVTAEAICDLLAQPETEEYYSARYAEAYLIRTVNKSTTAVWYHDQRAVEARVRLCAFFGVEEVCLSNLCSVADDSGYSLLRGLEE